MAKRYYLPWGTGSGGAAGASPAIDPAWNVNTASPVRLRLLPTPNGQGGLFQTVSETSASRANVFFRQYVSDPIGAQTISGTVTGRIRATEYNASANMAGQLIVRVVSGNGSTVRGTLYGGDTGTTVANEFDEVFTNRPFPGAYPSGAPLTSVDAQEGDRIVVEIGVRAFNTSATSHTAEIEFSSWQASDLPESLSGDGGKPWVEFSADILPEGSGPPPVTAKPWTRAYVLE